MPAYEATAAKVPTVRDEEVRYLSDKLGLSITLKMPRRIIIDGRDVIQTGLRAKFENGQFRTRNDDIIKLLDGMLTGHNARRWTRIFHRAPSAKEMEVMSKVAERAETAKRAALAEAVKNQPDAAKKFNSFQDFNKRRLAKATPGQRAVIGLQGD